MKYKGLIIYWFSKCIIKIAAEIHCKKKKITFFLRLHPVVLVLFMFFGMSDR